MIYFQIQMKCRKLFLVTRPIYKRLMYFFRLNLLVIYLSEMRSVICTKAALPIKITCT